MFFGLADQNRHHKKAKCHFSTDSHNYQGGFGSRGHGLAPRASPAWCKQHIALEQRPPLLRLGSSLPTRFTLLRGSPTRNKGWAIANVLPRIASQPHHLSLLFPRLNARQGCILTLANDADQVEITIWAKSHVGAVSWAPGSFSCNGHNIEPWRVHNMAASTSSVHRGRARLLCQRSPGSGLIKYWSSTFLSRAGRRYLHLGCHSIWAFWEKCGGDVGGYEERGAGRAEVGGVRCGESGHSSRPSPGMTERKFGSGRGGINTCLIKLKWHFGHPQHFSPGLGWGG